MAFDAPRDLDDAIAEIERLRDRVEKLEQAVVGVISSLADSSLGNAEGRMALAEARKLLP